MSGIATASLLPEAPRRRHEEDDLGSAFAQFMRWSLPADATFTHIPLGGQRHTKAAQRLAAQGTKAGWPDYIIVHRGRALFIELKTRTGSLSEVQRQMHRKLDYCGAMVAVCRSVAEAEAALRTWGVELRGSVGA